MEGLTRLLVLACTLAGCRGHSLVMGGCPRVRTLKQFDFDKFVGDWYVVQRFNPLSTCTKLSIAKDQEGQYTVSESRWPFGINFRSEHRPRRLRKISFPRDDTKSIFKVQRTFERFSLRTYGVLDTDYESYAVVWGCDPIFMGSIQNGDILSRHREVSPEVVRAARETLEDNGIAVSPRLRDVDQSRCKRLGRGGEKARDGGPQEKDDLGNNMVVDAQFVAAATTRPEWERFQQPLEEKEEEEMKEKEEKEEEEEEMKEKEEKEEEEAPNRNQREP